MSKFRGKRSKKEEDVDEEEIMMTKKQSPKRRQQQPPPQKAQLIRQPSAVEYTLQRFDPKTIREYSTILVAGGRRSGKSFCMRDFLYWLRNRVYDCYAYSGTIDEEHPWDKYTPAKYVTRVRSEFPDDQLQKALDKQEIRKAIATKHSADCPPSLFVFEDLEFLKKSMWKNQSIREVMCVLPLVIIYRSNSHCIIGSMDAGRRASPLLPCNTSWR